MTAPYVPPVKPDATSVTPKMHESGSIQTPHSEARGTNSSIASQHSTPTYDTVKSPSGTEYRVESTGNMSQDRRRARAVQAGVRPPKY
jgi:hypothetical protein